MRKTIPKGPLLSKAPASRVPENSGAAGEEVEHHVGSMSASPKGPSKGTESTLRPCSRRPRGDRCRGKGNMIEMFRAGTALGMSLPEMPWKAGTDLREDHSDFLSIYASSSLSAEIVMRKVDVMPV